MHNRRRRLARKNTRSASFGCIKRIIGSSSLKPHNVALIPISFEVFPHRRNVVNKILELQLCQFQCCEEVGHVCKDSMDSKVGHSTLDACPRRLGPGPPLLDSILLSNEGCRATPPSMPSLLGESWEMGTPTLLI
ncbi:uncharacterized protein LOC126409222 isoform X2 [Nymphaea colorata]|uniref:uncharacterized protein LOC126409222 isoform X2 n=1 Tax=Nymphaea colorata TaxID=210225 RepID=UPI00214ED08C|nr:uncharacterized protein LOC126409222 isoform X2 [Nymphaea colorata]